MSLSLTHDPPLFEQELLKLAAVHANAALADTDCRQFPLLDQLIRPSAR